MFLGLLDPDPDPLVRSMDPDPSITKQNIKKNLNSDFYLIRIPGSASGSISQRHGSADPDPDADPHQNVMDPQHCCN